jgi:gluconokinase
MRNNKQPFSIGIDLGTSSCKTILLSLGGKILGHTSTEYASDDAESKWKEQRPESLLNGVISSVSQAVESSGVIPADCLGISIGGAFHSLTVLDAKNHPLVGVLTWADSRASLQAEEVRKSGKAHEIYLRTGCPVHPMYPFIKILWFRKNHPDLFKKAAWFVSAKEYINYCLTHRRFVDYSIASASGLLNTHSLSWDVENLDIAGIRVEQLFSLSNPQDEVGGLLPEIAEQMSLLPGTMVYQGSSDAVNSSLGVGAILPNQITCMVGTSGAIRCIRDKPILDELERTWCYSIDHQHWIVGGSINNGGLAVNWLRDALSTGRSEKNNVPSFDDLINWANNIPAGSDGVVCLPFFTVERSPNWNSKVKGVFYGLQLGHDQRHLSRAILEGIAFRLRSVMEVLDEIIPGLNEVRVSGGFVQSQVWLQITSDVLNRTLCIPMEKETSGVAAAFWVLLAQGFYHSIEDINSLISIIDKVEPNQHYRSIYERQYLIYRELYKSLKPVFEFTWNE